MTPPETGPANHQLYAIDKRKLRQTKSSTAGFSSYRTNSPDYSGNRCYSMTGHSTSGGGRTSPPSGSGGFSSPVPDSLRDSHDLSISTGGRGRESLLDNLLLSFDNIGDNFGHFAFDSSQYFSAVDEVDDNESTYSRDDRRTNTAGRGGLYAQYTRRLEEENDHGYDYEEYEGGSFGVTYDSRPTTRSRGGTVGARGRGLDSSHGEYANGFDSHDSAPAPSIRTRNRTPSPKSPRLVRRPSNKSIKSLRRGDQHFGVPSESFALPPLPAFANPPLPPTATSMSTPNKSNPRPGFFRRVFWGGGSSSNTTNTKSTTPPSATDKPNAPSNAPVSPPLQQPIDSPQSVITKKASFFRRRKKSVSDASNHPIPLPLPLPLPPQITGDQPPVDGSGSPVTSLRTAMKPYIRSPGSRHSALDSPSIHDREPGYTARGATIRTVASSDPISPRRPSFFGESQRGRDKGSNFVDKGRKYKQEGWNARGSTANPNEQKNPNGISREVTDRPQTSPHSPLSRTFYTDKDKDERETGWPPSPLPPPRGILTNNNTNNTTSERERKGSMGIPSDGGRQSFVTSGSSRELPIANLRDMERMQLEEKSKTEKRNTRQLGLNTSNLELPAHDQSWLRSATPPLPRGGTPTVTLQRDGPGEMAEVLEEDDEGKLKKSTPRWRNTVDGPSEEDREMARKIFDGNEEFVSKARAAAWLGDQSEGRSYVRTAYLELFDWSGVNILSALRIFCGRVIFKGETQQVDRIVEGFAKRWCQCNPNHGFKGEDIVHTILYSLLLLNTDLHIADIPNSSKMTRGQFLKNTMSTIRRGIQESAAFELDDAPKPARLDSMPNRAQSQGEDDDPLVQTTAPSATFPLALGTNRGHKSRPSLEFKGSRLSRFGNLSSPRIEKDPEPQDYEMDGDIALVNYPASGGIRAWETQMEIILKDFYQSVKATALPLHGASQERIEHPQSNNLNVFAQGGMLRRSASTISKAPSEMSVARQGAVPNNNSSTKLNAKWASKNRSRQRVYNGSFAGSSRTSLEDRSMWSPSASSTWSKYSLDKNTQTSMSVDSLGSGYVNADYQQSIGFANALSNAIIREEAASGHSVDGGEVELLDGEDELELYGAPWAKEGMLKHKHHLDSVDKRAKNRSWTECFAVIQRGYMRLFLFPSRSSSGKSNVVAGGVVGGGNWTENAESIGSFLLRQTIASALPPPGYSKSRPNVWALSLPTGAVHFFEAGTADIVKEFVSTANYWSARLSKEPLIGGVSNVEYGWGNAIADLSEIMTVSPPTSMQSEVVGRSSLQMSIRSSIDHGSMRPRLPGDKVHIKDWSPPAQSMVASSLFEKDQLKALENYVTNIEVELTHHNELRPAMLMAFSPRHPNSSRALGNWEKKSSYLLREIIKFRTYIDTLREAIKAREAVRALRPPTAKSDLEIAGQLGDLDITPRG